MKRVEHNPLSLLRNPKAVKPLPVFLRESEMDRLFDDVVYPPNYEGARDRLILLTFYTTGIRLSELVGLDVTDVDLSQQELKVTGKRNKQRIVPFGRELSQAFREYILLLRRTGGCDGALFLSLKGQRISPAQVQQVVKKIFACHFAEETQSARPTTHVRHCDAQSRCRPRNDQRTLGARKCDYDGSLHTHHFCRPQESIRTSPP